MHAKFAISASWALAAVVLFSCGGGSDDGDKPSAEQIKDTCIKICQKMSSCAGLTFDCGAQCAENNAMGQIPPACNTNATMTKVRACLDVACTAVESCFTDATKGCSSSGTGGSGNGTGGSGNSTGGAASGDCSACSKNPACCTAIAMQVGQDASSCSQSTVASCTAASAQQSAVIQGCQQLVQLGVTLNIAACK
jgi:hypothetical protein